MSAQFPIGMIDVQKIAAPSFVRQQNGHDKESLNQLAASIQMHGLLQPIVVRPAVDDEKPAEWVVIAGRRRLAACKLAKMDAIPAIFVETDEARSYEMEIAENIQREQMTLADTARAVRTLMTIYNDQKKVCQILNKSPAWVSKHLAVTASNCPTVIQEMMDTGTVTDLETLNMLKQIAMTPASHPDAESTLARMVRIAAAGNMNRQIARDALAALRAPKNKAPSPVLTTTTTAQDATSTNHVTIEMDPSTHFSVQLPIEYIEKLEALAALRNRNILESSYAMEPAVIMELINEDLARLS